MWLVDSRTSFPTQVLCYLDKQAKLYINHRFYLFYAGTSLGRITMRPPLPPPLPPHPPRDDNTAPFDQIHSLKKVVTDGPTNGPTNRRMDKASYRDAWTHLKRLPNFVQKWLPPKHERLETHEEKLLGRSFSAHFSGNVWPFSDHIIGVPKDDLVILFKPSSRHPWVGFCILPSW